MVFASKLVAEPLGLAEGEEYIQIESSFDLDSSLRRLAKGDLDASGLIKRSYDKLKRYDWRSTAQVLREIYINASGDCAKTAWVDRG